MPVLDLLVTYMIINMKRSHPCIETEAEEATALTASPDAFTSSIGNQFCLYGFHPSFNIDTRGSFLSTRSVRVTKPRGSPDESDTTVLSNLPTVQPIYPEAKEQKIKMATVSKSPTSNMNNKEQLHEEAAPVHI